MAISRADVYYIKAVDSYGYDMDETITNLEYALGADNDHAAANRMMGSICADYLCNYELAESYFTTSMASDPRDQLTCGMYAELLLNMECIDQALKLIQYAHGLKGNRKSQLYMLESRAYELKGELLLAAELMEIAIAESFNRNLISTMEDELDRLYSKIRRMGEVSYNLN